MVESKPEPDRRGVRFIVLSVLLHGALLAAVARMAGNFEPMSRTEVVEVDVVPAKAETDHVRRQVVQSSKVERAETARADAMLSEQTQMVQRQTKAAVTARFREAHAGGADGREEQRRLSDLGVKLDLKPMGLAGPGETAATSDHLRDLRPGAQTLLNTKEFAYFSFFQRVRGQLEQYWEPGLRHRLEQLYSRGRTLASDTDHSTRLTVVLNGDGTITRILVEHTSGLLDLDQAAVDAFNRAGPFPNPPRGLLERDGTVRIEWEFVLKT